MPPPALAKVRRGEQAIDDGEVAAVAGDVGRPVELRGLLGPGAVVGVDEDDEEKDMDEMYGRGRSSLYGGDEDGSSWLSQ